MIQPWILQNHLETQQFGRYLIQMEQTDSTNRVLLDWVKSGSVPFPLVEGLTLIATRQTAGRGQYGRSWISTQGGLYLSVLLYPHGDIAEAQSLTVALGWGVVKQLRAALTLNNLGVKWPNDIVSDGCKLGGILVQSRSRQGSLQAAVVGVGVNILNQGPPGAIALQDLLSTDVDFAQVTARVLGGLELGYRTWRDTRLARIRAEYETWMMHPVGSLLDLGQDGSEPGRLLGLAESGALRVQTQGGVVCIQAGEIRLGYARPSQSSH